MSNILLDFFHLGHRTQHSRHWHWDRIRCYCDKERTKKSLYRICWTIPNNIFYCRNMSYIFSGPLSLQSYNWWPLFCQQTADDRKQFLMPTVRPRGRADRSFLPLFILLDNLNTFSVGSWSIWSRLPHKTLLNELWLVHSEAPGPYSSLS